ncbi:methyl-accepting chemotaxis protein [Alkalihalophilus pseudofirmus]|nr:methyl-accepting chemotaxis protein [Alkalihalophilus pseudofirmus]
MGEKKSYRLSIRKKLVVGISGLALITYGTSAFFIFFLADYLQGFWSINSDIFTIITLVLGVIWCGILGFLAAPLITKPLSELEEAARKAAAGDIKVDVKISKSDDEIRALGLAFSEMLSSLRLMVKDIEDNFEQTNQKVSEITNASELASEKADNIGRTIEEIAKGAESSADAIQNTAESMEDVSTIAMKVQDRASASKGSAEHMVEKLTESRKVIDHLVNGIKKLAEDNQHSLTAVERLNRQAKQVEDIISLVGDIAAQTNLLALNASIEAARAGEQGKGFAVVADEVRKLADESSKAVQGITKLITDIQHEVKNVVTQITAQVQVANEQSEKGSETNEAIRLMEKSILEVSEAIHDISQLIDNQLGSIMSTTQETQEVAAIAEETSAGALEVATATDQQTAIIEEVAATAQILNGQAQKLKATIAKFST